MADIALIWDNANGRADFAVENGDLVMDQGLRTSLILSYFCDRLADPSDVIPDGSTDRRGWWGDTPGQSTVFDGRGFILTGSKLWLLIDALQVPDTLRRAEAYCLQATRWYVTNNVAESVTPTASFPRRGWLLINTVIKQGTTATAYDFAWGKT